MRKNFKCTVAYDGSPYYGWQKQDNFVTVQGMIEYALEKTFNHKIPTKGASRTDAGVHAYGNVFSFSAETPMDGKGVKAVLNNILPEDIRIMECISAEGYFHPRNNVRKKFYRYVIYNSPVAYPFQRKYAWHIEGKLNVRKTNEALPLFAGRKNYTAFSASGSEAEDFVRSFDSIKVKKAGKLVILDFTGRTFLYKMIRKVTAALVSYAFGKLSKADIEEMFTAQDRKLLKGCAPAGGLYLVKIIYRKPE
jgi:tRNA pseudouridine38-40 synthase